MTVGETGLAHQLWISGALIAATTFVHGVSIAAAGAFFRATRIQTRGVSRFLHDSFILVVMSLMMMAAHSLEIWMWAETFLRIEIFEGIEPALYFAAVSFTTLGFGDVLLEPPWRLLAGAAAANGLLLFGLSAAFMVDTCIKLGLGGPPREV
ncbi:MAG: ion channel [Pseudomonadota bacterium]